MKQFKKFIIIILIFTLCITKINALTDEEKYAKLDNLPFYKSNDGKYSINLKMVDPTKYISNQCDYNINDYIDSFEPNEEFTTVEQQVNYEENMCKSYFYQDAIKTYLKHSNYDTVDLFITFDLYAQTFDKTHGVFTYFDQTEDGVDIQYPVEIKYLDSYDEKIYNNSSKLLKSFGEGEQLYDLGLINMIYHYGEISEDNLLEDQILYRFSKFKKIIEKNPEYEFVINGGRGGCGIPTCSRMIQVGVFKDNILYEVKQISYDEEHILLVDKNQTGTLEDKIKTRLNNYFNNKVDFKITIEEENEDLNASWFDDEINKLLDTKNVDYKGQEIQITLNENKVNLVVIEVDKKYLKNHKVESYDKKTGVNIKTESYDVPVDASVSTNEYTNNKNIKDIFNKKGLNIELALDINLKSVYNDTKINKIENGIEVYMPVADYYDIGEKIDVFYVKTNYDIGDTIEGEIVEIEGVKYVKFITNHFSIYAIANTGIENPKTFDNIVFYFIGLISSVLVAAFISLYLLKNDKI